MLDQLLDRTEQSGGTDTVDAGQPEAVAVVSGVAGVGKTALALRWAHRVRQEFPDGRLFVDLAGHGRGHSVAATDALAGCLAALGVPVQDIPQDVDGRAARYRRQLAGRRVLVVIDGAVSSEQVRPLLPGDDSGAGGGDQPRPTSRAGCGSAG